MSKFIIGDDDGPWRAIIAEHLLGLEDLAFFEDHASDGLGGGGGGVKGLLDAIDEGDGDLGREIVGAALDGELAGGVRFLRLPCVALRQELQARSRARVQRVELYPYLRKELQHSANSVGRSCVRRCFWFSFGVYQELPTRPDPNLFWAIDGSFFKMIFLIFFLKKLHYLQAATRPPPPPLPYRRVFSPSSLRSNQTNAKTTSPLLISPWKLSYQKSKLNSPGKFRKTPGPLQKNSCWTNLGFPRGCSARLGLPGETCRGD